MTAQQLWRWARKCGLDIMGRRVASAWPFPVCVTVVGGRQMYVDLRSPIGRGLFATGTFDIEAIQPALDVLQEGATFIDIGANIGFYSVLALDRVGSSGKVYGFEIDPRPLRCLRRTITQFGYSNIHVTEAAVADVDGMLSFEPRADHGHNSIDRSATSGAKVRSVKLDTWAENMALARVDAIKIDVEGAERLVLEGARETISRFKPLLLCEAQEQTAGSFGYTPRDLIMDLEYLGYRSVWLSGVDTPTILAMPG